MFQDYPPTLKLRPLHKYADQKCEKNLENGFAAQNQGDPRALGGSRDAVLQYQEQDNIFALDNYTICRIKPRQERRGRGKGNDFS